MLPQEQIYSFRVHTHLERGEENCRVAPPDSALIHHKPVQHFNIARRKMTCDFFLYIMKCIQIACFVNYIKIYQAFVIYIYLVNDLVKMTLDAQYYGVACKI